MTTGKTKTHNYRTLRQDDNLSSGARIIRRGRVLIALTMLTAACVLSDTLTAGQSIGLPLVSARNVGTRDVPDNSTAPGNSTMPSTSAAAATFNWTQIQPSETLEWTPCYDTFQCTRFSVPIDYANPSLGSGAVAIIRSPAPNSTAESGYQGPILLNPGGPGDSGVNFLLTTLAPLRTVLGPTFDLVSFDPRGVGFTTPTVTPFSSSGELGMFLQRLTTLLNSTENAFSEAYANGQILGSLTQDRIGEAAKYVGTAAVARDMLGITKAHGQDKLQYWGISYGTTLGATFTAMFPNNVGRIILDGVMDVEGYYQGRLTNDLQDANAALNTIYQACIDAGPAQCPIFENTTDQISARVDKLLAELHTDAIPYYNSTTHSYGLVDYSAVKRTIFLSLYNPLDSGPLILDALARVEQRQPEQLWLLSQLSSLQDLITAPGVCPDPGPENQTGLGALYLIQCGDAEPASNNISLSDLKAAYNKLAKNSTFAEAWVVKAACSGYKVSAVERLNVSSLVTNSSFPVLLIGNTRDPITPLAQFV